MVQLSYSDLCVYCGALSTDKDHILLKSNFPNKIAYTVPSCKECNSRILNNKVFYSFIERCSYVKLKLKQKYSDEKELPYSKEELEEMGYTIKCMIEQGNNKIQLNKLRMNWQHTKEFIDMYEEIKQRILKLTKDTDYLNLFK